MECGLADLSTLCRDPLPAFQACAVPQDRPRFLAVIALYGMKPSDSASLRTLEAARLSSELGALDVLIYDNTPGVDLQRPAELPDGVGYYARGHNDGIASAFNYGLVLAQQRKCDWLITLDQDTVLPTNFLGQIASVVEKIKHEPSIAAIVPQITGDGRMLSPNWFWAGAVPRWLPKGYIGVPPHPTFAFNSASTLRVSALQQIGGYSPRFWLDNSDSYLYHRLHLYGKRVFVAGDIQVDHHFSMLDKKNRMSISRYRNVLKAESAFWDTSMNWLAGIERTTRLIGRWGKQLLDPDAKELRQETALAINRRLFSTRKSRAQRWKREVELSETHPDRKDTQLARPLKISVCMAAYNGEKFIQEQVASVLRQLESGDELIIVDDASQDLTRDVIAEFHDHRLILIRHDSRRGIVSTFEHAIRSASGDMIFLCDQDDVWSPNKVSRVTRILFEHPEVSLVATNLKIIDENGKTVADRGSDTKRPFDSRLLPNLFSNRFQGSAMAFRSSLIQEVLPFPQGCYLLHDAWIGLRNTQVGRKAYYLDEDLLLYRRHSRNASHRLNVAQKIFKRTRLLTALVQRSLRDKLAGADRVE
jgi:glycosyltransferase involved in cell wall biosynthesis